MPSVTRNPGDELLRRLGELESRLRALETQRSRPNFGGGASIAFSVSHPTAPSEHVLPLASTVYDTGGVVDLTNNRLVIPIDGVYLVHIGNPGAGTNATSLAWGYGLNGSMSQYSLDAYSSAALRAIRWPQAYVAPFHAGDLVDCRFTPGSGATFVLADAFTLSVDRLHDL